MLARGLFGLSTGGALTVLIVGGTAADPNDRELLEAAVAAARTIQMTAIVGRLTPVRVGLVVSRRSGEGDAGLVERIIESLPSELVAVAGAAGPVTAFSDLSSALAEAAFVVDVQAATARSMPLRVWRSADLGGQGLLWQLRMDPRLLSYVDAQLRQLLSLDERIRGQMRDTLSAYLESGGMTAFATMINLSRPAAYARLARLREILGCDLDQPRTRLSLHLAMLALQQDRDAAAPPGTPPDRPQGPARRSAAGRPR